MTALKHIVRAGGWGGWAGGVAYRPRQEGVWLSVEVQLDLLRAAFALGRASAIAIEEEGRWYLVGFGYTPEGYKDGPYFWWMDHRKTLDLDERKQRYPNLPAPRQGEELDDAWIERLRPLLTKRAEAMRAYDEARSPA